MARISSQRARPPAWTFAAFLLAFAAQGVMAAEAHARHLQCVPYARQVSGIEIYGDAHLWWGRAEGRYRRGDEPRIGAVMAFQRTAAMPLGHVAVVGEIVDERRVLLDHANWSGPGVIENRALAEDVSEDGDWSAVRVWWGPGGRLGARINPVFGFIYEDPPEEAPGTLASTNAAESNEG